MCRVAAIIALFLAGCSTAPVADFLDIVSPAPKAPPAAVPGIQVLPTFPTPPVAPPVTAPAMGSLPPQPTAPPAPSWPGL
jgi:hypothetical protein